MSIPDGERGITLSIKKIFRYVKSIRFLMALLFIAIGIIPMVTASNMALRAYYQAELNQRLGSMQNSCVSLADSMSSYHYLENADSLDVLTGQMKMLADAYDGRIQVINSDYRICKDTYGVSTGKYSISKEVFLAFSGRSYSNIDTQNGCMEFISTIMDSTGSEIEGVMVVTASITGMKLRYNTLRTRMTNAQIAFGILIVIVSFVLAECFEKPFRRLILTLTKINKGDPTAKIVNRGFTEIKDINNGYSGAMKQLRDIDQSRQEFVSNVSHELKTPITSVKVLVDTLLMSDHVSEEVYREFLTDISNEVNRETDIINDLLSLVRLDKSSNTLNFKSVAINDFVEEILHRLKPIAAERNIELTYETFRPVTAEIDEVKLSLAVMNIVENAIKYNVDHGWVRVSLNADHKYFYIDVTDSGVGIPEDAMDKIFERFYRVDKARSRETGGTGLGLAITKQIVLMHGGDITVSAPAQGGSQFVISVPLTRAGGGTK